MNGWNGTRWYTKNAIAKLGGYVNDEDGVGIIKVTKYEYKVKPVDGLKVKDPKTGAEKEDDGTRIGTGIRGDIVFNEDVIKGITLPPATKLKEAPPTHEVEGILLDSYSDHPEITHVPQDAAFYRPDTDKIYLPLREQFHSTEEYLDTLFHELTHSTMAPHRLDRKSDLDLDKYGTHKDVRAREELVAEMGSAILSSIFGVNTDIKNVAAYVQSWKKFLEHEPQALYEAASLSSKAVEHMLRGWNGHLDQEEEDEYEQPEAVNMPIGDITGEDGTSGGLGGGVNYRIEGNRIFLMGDTFNKKDIVKSVSLIPNGKKIPFSFFWDKKANNWSISLEDPAQRVQILNELKAKLA
jgi:antirestriction protein ArdC